MKINKIVTNISLIVICGMVSWVLTLLYRWGNLGGEPGKEKALFSAVSRNDTNEVIRLLNAKVNPNARSIQLNRQTPLIDAVRFGDIEIVRLLLDGGANPDVNDAIGLSPLYHSLTSPYLDDNSISSNIVQILIDHGADLSGKGIGDAADALGTNDSRVKAYLQARSKKSPIKGSIPSIDTTR